MNVGFDIQPIWIMVWFLTECCLILCADECNGTYSAYSIGRLKKMDWRILESDNLYGRSHAEFSCRYKRRDKSNMP